MDKWPNFFNFFIRFVPNLFQPIWPSMSTGRSTTPDPEPEVVDFPGKVSFETNLSGSNIVIENKLVGVGPFVYNLLHLFPFVGDVTIEKILIENTSLF